MNPRAGSYCSPETLGDKGKYLKKTILVFILLTIQVIVLHAQAINTTQHKIKAKQYSNGLTHVKLLLKNDMLLKQEAENKNVPQSFIKSVRLFEGDNLIYHATLTPHIAKNPLLKFKYYGGNSPTLRLETIDNNNKLVKQDTFIRKSSISQDFSTIKKVKNSNQIIKIENHAIQNMFKNIKIIKSKNIKIIAPDISSNPSAVFIKIQSNIKAKVVTLFATELDYKRSYTDLKYNTIAFDNQDLAFVYQYFVQEKSIIDFGVKIKLSYGKNSKILVIVEAEDGTLYMAEKSIELAICIDSGG